ncbi:MAG: FAD-dependent oxidoreductase, partial [Myxococcota bacterium]
MDTWLSILLGAAALLAGFPLLLWLYSRTMPRPDRAFFGFRNRIAALIEARLGGYRHAHTIPDPTAPERVTEPLRVAVVGGGLGGVGAATTLAERGADVVIFEKNPYFGGKIAAWEDVTSDGSTQKVAHGFHAFFRNYYNLNDFLRRIGIHQQFTSLDDYQVLSAEGELHSYKDIDTAPVLNLVSLGDHGVFDWSDILFSQAIHEMDRFLLYDEETTFEQLDHVPFDRFAERAELPKSLMLSFNSFSRAFFADPDRLSTAELIRSFHFYYLSQDAGLIYDLPADWFGDAL